MSIIHYFIITNNSYLKYYFLSIKEKKLLNNYFDVYSITYY